VLRGKTSEHPYQASPECRYQTDEFHTALLNGPFLCNTVVVFVKRALMLLL